MVSAVETQTLRSESRPDIIAMVGRRRLFMHVGAEISAGDAHALWRNRARDLQSADRFDDQLQ